MSKRFLVVLAAVIIGLGFIFWITRDEAGAPSDGSATQGSNHTYGEGKSGVVLIEYGDFQCPACGAFFPILQSLKEKFKEDIIFQFRNFPLTQIHPNAQAAHRAAEAAAKQNKFWEMHDMLYQQQSSWSASTNPVPVFDQYAGQLGLDLTQFKQDFSSSEVNDIINADIKEGQAIGATSTPTFVLDGKKLEQNPTDQEAFEQLISEAIAAKKQ